MAEPKKTTEKRHRKPLVGKKFSKDNQPTPEAKSAGWQEWRKERHLTQSIIKELTGNGGKKFKEYINSLLENAKSGNPKAIDIVSKCLEDDVIKIEHKHRVGKDLADEEYK